MGAIAYPGINKIRKRKSAPKKVLKDEPLRMKMDKTRDIPSAGGFGSSDSTARNTAMEKRYNESQEVREEMERKAQRLAPLHKGAYTYIDDNADMAEYGRKNAVL